MIEILESGPEPGRRTDFVAVGNWRVIGHDTCPLARPPRRPPHPQRAVRRCARLERSQDRRRRRRVAGECARWGTCSRSSASDRAFDAVGDVAASLGIDFRRLSHQGITGATEARAPVREAPTESRSSRYRGRSRRRGPWRDRAASGAPAPGGPRRAPSSRLPSSRVAPREVEPLAMAPTARPPVVQGSPRRACLADRAPRRAHRARARPDAALAGAAADARHARQCAQVARLQPPPQGSPGLITRLRRIKEIALSRAGVITLVGGGEGAGPREEAPAVPPDVVEADVVEAKGGRSRGRRAVEADVEAEAEEVEPGNVAPVKGVQSARHHGDGTSTSSRPTRARARARADEAVPGHAAVAPLRPGIPAVGGLAGAAAAAIAPARRPPGRSEDGLAGAAPIEGAGAGQRP